jgi:hypothetical protein
MQRGTLGSSVALVIAVLLASPVGATEESIAGKIPAVEAERPAPAAAESTESFAVDGGAHAMFLFGQRCTRLASDVVECTDVGMAGGFHLSPSFRISPYWSAGIRGAVTFSGGGGNHEDSLAFWQIEAEARYHLLGASRTDFWVALDTGVLVLAEHVGASEIGPADSFTSTHPLFGLGLGAGFPIASAFRLGPEARVLYIPMGDDLNSIPRGTSLASQTGVSLAITATAAFGS